MKKCKVAIIGTGRIGSATAFCLAQHESIQELLLINRTELNAKGLKADLVSTFPREGKKLKVTNMEEAGEADLILISGGVLGDPTQKIFWDKNVVMIRDIFSRMNPKKTCKIVVITTPPDKMVQLVLKLSGLPPGQVMAFGGQLDIKRLEYLIYSDHHDYEKKVDVNFIGEHGERGIPLFSEPVSDRRVISRRSKLYFKEELAEYGASTFGTARELSLLAEALMKEEETVLNISHYQEEYGLFVLWPCRVNWDGVQGRIPLELEPEVKEEFEALMRVRKEELNQLLPE